MLFGFEKCSFENCLFYMVLFVSFSSLEWWTIYWINLSHLLLTSSCTFVGKLSLKQGKNHRFHYLQCVEMLWEFKEADHNSSTESNCHNIVDQIGAKICLCIRFLLGLILSDLVCQQTFFELSLNFGLFFFFWIFFPKKPAFLILIFKKWFFLNFILSTVLITLSIGVLCDAMWFDLFCGIWWYDLLLWYCFTKSGVSSFHVIIEK